MDTGAVGRIFSYGVVSRLYFHLPVLFVFLLLRDYGILAVEVLLAVYGVSLTLASWAGQSLPATLSQRAVIAFGEALKAVGLVLIVVSTSYWAAFAGQILAGVGFGLTAGRETALLRAVAPPDRATVLQGNLQSYIFLSTLVGGVLGAVLFTWAQSLPFLASIASILVAAAIVAAVREPARTSAPAGAASASASTGEPGRRSGRGIWVSYYVVSRALAMALFVGFLPYLFFVQMELPVAWFGVVLGLYSVTAFLSARYVSRAGQVIGNLTAAVLSALLILVAVLLFAQGSRAAGLIGIAVLGLGAGGIRPLGLAGLRLAELAPDVRARLLLRQEQLFGLVNAAALVLGGVILANLSFRDTMIAFAIGFAVFAAGFAAAIWMSRSRVGASDAARR
ncbi:MAG TPA: hypothetical protein VFM55_07030 [Micromonosporaceae bacterium]|nr:hypothetical protein [Micromonosporaceae bacterium]